MIKHLFRCRPADGGRQFRLTPSRPPRRRRATDPQVAAMPSGADAKKLIGRNVKNPQDETVGEIESVYINADGKVDSVILGVGGFLGVGERHVRVAWKDLRISDNGEKVVINATKDAAEGDGALYLSRRQAARPGLHRRYRRLCAPAAASRPEGHRRSDRIRPATSTPTARSPAMP